MKLDGSSIDDIKAAIQAAAHRPTLLSELKLRLQHELLSAQEAEELVALIRKKTKKR